MDTSDLVDLARKEFVKLDIIDKEDSIDETVVRAMKEYPAQFRKYDRFKVVSISLTDTQTSSRWAEKE
ncbi:MAG: hypothetical protein JW738_04990 [Actinobacteria bacterium]|nr:hypothetical protein [Actinomycetota bacterium]